MNSNTISLIFGFTGCFFLSVSFLPQLVKSYKDTTGETNSYGFLFLEIIASISLLVSSVINMNLFGITSLPFVIANGFVLLLCLIMLFLKFKYRNNQITN